MAINFENILEHTIQLIDFELDWRFNDERYDKIPGQHLALLQPLNKKASKFLWDYINLVGLHNDFPFKKGFFYTIDKAKILPDNQRDIKKWLYRRAISFNTPVFLSWQPEIAMIVPWKILIKYFDSFYYGSSDDLTVISSDLIWALLFYHEDEIYFGTNKEYNLDKMFDDIDFIW